MSKSYDVIIVGGGMVGGALACGLGKAGINTLVLDAVSPVMDWPPKDYELRVSAITAKSQHFLEAIGAWSGISKRRLSPFREMHVWDAQGKGEIHFDSAEVGAPTLGNIIENLAIQQSLIDQFEQYDCVEYRHPLRIKALHLETDHAELETSEGETLSARLLAGADGARSWLRSQFDIETIGWSYHQKGLVCVVSTEQGHHETAWQRFLPTGPLAFLPLADGRCSIVWSTTEEEANRLLGLNETDFLNELNEALHESPMGKVIGCGKRAAFPLRLQHSTRYIDHRLALVGDAAHTIHPLAGQGVNLGFADAEELTTLLSTAKLDGIKDLGNKVLLRQYERARKGENLGMMGVMDGFKRLFSNDQAALSGLRNFGLGLTNKAGPVKNLIMRKAMGLDRASV
ncbi:MAG: UbiH/UbiF/VisC/COQ6 family ubiquinone biosynthesis hydroxylase [Gammaproteobacteria bacterium]|nr:UbiH/UbiF/VisC/COQ6 family ubiquinone biosynthesis hydroxylase [Gammaproteobacteria bacterium]